MGYELSLVGNKVEQCAYSIDKPGAQRLHVSLPRLLFIGSISIVGNSKRSVFNSTKTSLDSPHGLIPSTRTDSEFQFEQASKRSYEFVLPDTFLFGQKFEHRGSTRTIAENSKWQCHEKSSQQRIFFVVPFLLFT